MNYKSKTDKELVLSTQEGDTTAFNMLVIRYQNSVRATVNLFLHNSSETDDVTQDAFIRGFLKISTLHPPYNFGAWIMQIARNIARNKCMRRPKILRLEKEGNVTIDNPLDKVEKQEQMVRRVNQVINALSRLSPPLRETARLAYLSTCSQKEIKTKLCIPTGTVKRRLWEARKKIKGEVRKMSRKGIESETPTLVPRISITDIPNISLRVPVSGYGLYFASILEKGEVEVCKFYDYPGGILTETARSEVMRKVNLFGRDCFEVLITHTDCEPPQPNALCYFEVRKDGIQWVMRITADKTYPRLDGSVKKEEIAPLYYDTNDSRSCIKSRVVQLKIGHKNYGQCLAVIEGWQDETPCERFYTKEGRQVLHRRYVGPNAVNSTYYNYGKLPTEPKLVIGNTEYRLWYDTVLIQGHLPGSG